MRKYASVLPGELQDLTKEIALISPTDTPLTTLLYSMGKTVEDDVSEELSSRLLISRNTEINPYISDDFKVLQEHYTIVLTYCKELEDKLMKLKRQKEICERRIYWLEKKLKERDEREEREYGICFKK